MLENQLFKKLTPWLIPPEFMPDDYPFAEGEIERRTAVHLLMEQMSASMPTLIERWPSFSEAERQIVLEVFYQDLIGYADQLRIKELAEFIKKVNPKEAQRLRKEPRRYNTPWELLSTLGISFSTQEKNAYARRLEERMKMEQLSGLFQFNFVRQQHTRPMIPEDSAFGYENMAQRTTG